jgi:hypothetical protein
MTTADYENALFVPLFRQYWWLVLIMIAASVLKLFAPIIKGKIGEGVVNLAAKLRLDPKVYHLLKDVTIPTKNGTTQIDHIIISIYGLFVIETKNYAGWIFADAKSKQWTQVNFKQKNRFQNPLHQNFGHICALSDLLDVPKEKIHGVVCFMGDATFKTDVPNGVFIQGRYVSYIETFKTPVFSNDEVEDLIRRIESGRLERGHKTNRQHVQQLRSRRAADREQKTDHLQPGIGTSDVLHGGTGAVPSYPREAFHSLGRHRGHPSKNHSATTSFCQNSCPKCGSEMVLRTARHGPNAGNQFWGCSAYPKCRSTQPVVE